MLALTLIRPWGYFIFREPEPDEPTKDVENRAWKTDVRGFVFITSGKGWDKNEFPLYKGGKLMSPVYTDLPISNLPMHESEYPTGVLGIVEIVDCVTNSSSPWFTGPYGFVLRNPRKFDKPIALPGQQKFFNITNREVLQAANYQFGTHSPICVNVNCTMDNSLASDYHPLEEKFCRKCGSELREYLRC